MLILSISSAQSQVIDLNKQNQSYEVITSKITLVIDSTIIPIAVEFTPTPSGIEKKYFVYQYDRKVDVTKEVNEWDQCVQKKNDRGREIVLARLQDKIHPTIKEPEPKKSWLYDLGEKNPVVRWFVLLGIVFGVYWIGYSVGRRK